MRIPVGGINHNLRVYRLVAEHFIPNTRIRTDPACKVVEHKLHADKQDAILWRNQKEHMYGYTTENLSQKMIREIDAMIVQNNEINDMCSTVDRIASRIGLTV